MKTFKNGYYKPIHKEKCLTSMPFYRSSWERKFFYWCDKNPNVVAWGAEEVIVPYKSPVDGKMHRYFVDNFVVINEGNVQKRYLIEIKPKIQTVAPVPSKRKKQKTVLYENLQWSVNQAKWDSAKKWASQKGVEFLILTEDELFTD